MFADTPFVPAPGLSSGHLMTIYAWARSRRYPGLPATETRLIRVDAENQIRADCFWQGRRTDAATLIGLHGLEGSSEAHYMRGIAHKAWHRGWNVVLLNHRGCGGTEHLAPGLYHSGLTADPLSVMRTLAATEHLPSFAVAGYSLGGNIAVKLAGELPGLPAADRPAVLGIAAVSPTVDLSLCVEALERWPNIGYQWNFVHGLKGRMRRKGAAFPGRFELSHLAGIRTVRQFDDAYTAPLSGFGTAARYYDTCSALRVVQHIAVPTLIVSAEDDPFVPVSQFFDDDVRHNDHVHVSIQRHGGHCGFVGRATDTSDGYWAEEAVVDFLTRSQSHET